MKLFKIIGGIFAMIGVAALVGMAFAIVGTNSFIKQSSVTSGEIIDIVTRTSKDSDGNTTRSHYPVVRFNDATGNAVEFESSTSTSSRTGIGEHVQVRYIPDNPSKARISSSFLDMWGVSLMLGIFGVVFAGLGVPFFWLGIREELSEKNAQSYTREISADVKEIFHNTSISMNGRSPYQIVAQWLDADSNEIHVFKSKNFWYDPSEFVKEKIPVKADPRNLKKYWMDVSALPKKV